jgi:hypothetical protein
MAKAIQEELYKGELMEEQLRAYFHDMGYYVIRAIKYKFQGFDVTDIDLWLYNRPTSLSRERVNVDVKYKQRPAAVERIFWARGIKEILGLDRCLVATTDRREGIRQFGQKHDVTVLDGNFLQKIKSVAFNRHSEESFNALLKHDFSKFTTNWVMLYENSKSRLIEGLDFTTCNSILLDIKSILEQIAVAPLQRGPLLRLFYVVLSHFLISVDFLLKDMAFTEAQLKYKTLDDGFRYGNTSTIHIQERLNQLSIQTGTSVFQIKRALDAMPVEILREFFGKNENGKSLFKWAKDLESAAYSLNFVPPTSIELDLKSLIGMICDFCQIDRKVILTLNTE